MNQPTDNDEPQHRFEVAISFASDDKRDLVREVAELLRDRIGAGKVFFDEWFEHEIAGIDADTLLQDFYRKQTRLVVTCVCKRYGEKPWTKVEWRAIRTLHQMSETEFDRNRFLPLRFGDGEVEGIFDIDHVPDVRERTPKDVADLILKRLELVSLGIQPANAYINRKLLVPSEPNAEADDINENQINMLIGRLRQHPFDTVMPVVSIANAIVRGSIVNDTQYAEGEHLVASTIHGLVNEIVATDGDTPPIIRFVVLLHQLLSSGSDAQTGVRQWFEQVCQTAGYDFDTVLGELPAYPDENQRFIWLDVFWDDPIPGETVSRAVSYLRCGHLKYPFMSENSDLNQRTQVNVIVRNFQKTEQHRTPINHVSVVSKFEDFHKDWEYLVNKHAQNHNGFIEIPVTIRGAPTAGVRKCPKAIGENHIVPFADPDDFSLHVQKYGVFITGKLDGTGQCPCDVVKVLLTHATIGIWTRGEIISDSDEEQLQSTFLNKRVEEIPRLLHQRRTGAVSADSIWRRTVLFFDPNIRPVAMTADDDMALTNIQLA